MHIVNEKLKDIVKREIFNKELDETTLQECYMQLDLADY